MVQFIHYEMQVQHQIVVTTILSYQIIRILISSYRLCLLLL
nr:MAG TPA: hypothetical protein [Caudoviricetes sp.]